MERIKICLACSGQILCPLPKTHYGASLIAKRLLRMLKMLEELHGTNVNHLPF
jgi:hypothetical protein